MTKVVTAYGNYAKAKIDHAMMGRFDLPIYLTGADVFQNFISNYEGNAIFSAGFSDRVSFQDCAFMEFKFGNTQNYIVVMFNLKLRFLAYDSNGVFGWVLDGSSAILEVASPYSLAEAKQICKAQSYSQFNNQMTICHRSYAPYRLTRTAANAFTMATFTRTADPFTSTDNYPGACLYYKGRLYYASTNTQPTKIWFSISGVYDDLTISSPLTDASGFNFGVADITQRIEWLFGGDNSLIAGSTDGIVAINGGGVNTAITAATVQANITTAEPTNGSYPIKKDGLIFYIGRNNRNMYYFKYDILSESFLSSDANVISYDITKGGLNKIRFKKDRNDLIFTLRGDGQLTSLNFKDLQNENINGWHERLTLGSFTDVAQIADNLGNPQLFVLALRNGTYYIEQQADYVEFVQRIQFYTGPEYANGLDDDEAYIRKLADQLRDCIYLDNALTYSDLRTSTLTFTPTTFDSDGNPTAGTIASTASDFAAPDKGKHLVYKTSTGYESGRFEVTTYNAANNVTVRVLQIPKKAAGVALNVWSSWYKSFTQISGLSQYNGQLVGVVTDGGFLNNVVVSGGAMTFDGQTTSVVIGYGYTGIIKSFPLGFQYQGSNTQSTLKDIVRVGLRTVASAGGKIGSSMYYLQPYQELGQNDLNYLPPVPVDGTQFVDYVDDTSEDKCYYIVQDQPLPFQLCNAMIEANYATSS